MDPGLETKANRLTDACTRQEALALFWPLARTIAGQVQERRALQRRIGERWGRAPRLPKWWPGTAGAPPGRRAS
jgi:hypothetical protein